MPETPINATCPWSGKPTTPDSVTLWQGWPVGFCNPGCRDKFAAAQAHFTAALPQPRRLRPAAPPAALAAALAEAALVVIDAQGEYGPAGALPLEGLDSALAALARLLEAARAAGAPVLHVAHRGAPGGLFDRAAPGGAFLPVASPAPGEAVVEKTLPDAFAGTPLAEALAATGRRAVLLAGFMTHNCIAATAHAALSRGLAVSIAADATATRALPGAAGAPAISAAALQAATLAGLADRVALVAPVEEILADVREAGATAAEAVA
ncbi:isochorismatase family protein [Roseomonas sp. GC11]|uniref:isochorismatase family protein n=1 Tax=Roseomonas sp. GC11 TaxID=2950546 RepID=UPI00210A3AAC|nr:isochorismatase family protein [Roseomonas sp. GC11]MCQ4159610.1 isochorismatase family protein [Roseomonas sp. GC11]